MAAAQDADPSSPAPASARRAETIDRRTSLYRDAVAIVEAEYGSDLHLDEVARRVACSRRQLQRCYAEIADTTFRRHLAEVRMRFAAKQLMCTTSIREAGRRVAYPHPAQFAKVFRLHYGVSPSVFRAALRAQRSVLREDAARADVLAEAARGPARVDARGTTVLDAIDRRITVLLALCDHDHDGLLDTFDAKEWVDRLGALRDWEPGDDGYRALLDLFVDRGFRHMQATYPRDDGCVTVAAMRDGLRTMARSRAASANEAADALFDLLAARGSGDLGLEQYRDLLSSVCVSRSDADASFAHLGLLADRRITRRGFRTLCLGFMLDEDPHGVAAWFWGPTPVGSPAWQQQRGCSVLGSPFVGVVTRQLR